MTISNLKPFPKGDTDAKVSRKPVKSVAAFTTYFREICNDPNVKRVFKDKLLEMLVSDDKKSNMFALDFIGKRMIQTAESEMEKDKVEVEAHNQAEILDLAKKRILQMESTLKTKEDDK